MTVCKIWYLIIVPLSVFDPYPAVWRQSSIQFNVDLSKPHISCLEGRVAYDGRHSGTEHPTTLTQMSEVKGPLSSTCSKTCWIQTQRDKGKKQDHIYPIKHQIPTVVGFCEISVFTPSALGLKKQKRCSLWFKNTQKNYIFTLFLFHTSWTFSILLSAYT